MSEVGNPETLVGELRWEGAGMPPTAPWASDAQAQTATAVYVVFPVRQTKRPRGGRGGPAKARPPYRLPLACGRWAVPGTCQASWVSEMRRLLPLSAGRNRATVKNLPPGGCACRTCFSADGPSGCAHPLTAHIVLSESSRRQRPTPGATPLKCAEYIQSQKPKAGNGSNSSMERGFYLGRWKHFGASCAGRFTMLPMYDNATVIKTFHFVSCEFHLNLKKKKEPARAPASVAQCV